jgi:hypothetical protein
VALRELINEHGASDWTLIASYLEGRNPRQCKERWTNYLSPDICDAPWSAEEDLLLCQKQRELGCKWVQIAAFLPNRTDAMAKNRFNRLKRREQKQIEMVARPEARPMPFFPPGCVASSPEPAAEPASIAPPLPETNESSLWEDQFPLDDCFADAFSWI